MVCVISAFNAPHCQHIGTGGALIRRYQLLHCSSVIIISFLHFFAIAFFEYIV